MLALLLACAAPAATEAPAPPPTAAPAPPPVTAPYTIHEWGTFTTVADDAGRPLAWRPFIGRPDLPPFVYELQRHGKGLTVGHVRMETPVIYFYTPSPLDVSVHVRLNDGIFTEWFPAAQFQPKHSDELTWPVVHVGAEGEPEPSQVESHYLAARAVPDAALVAVGRERERFLFYRGIAEFDPGHTFRLDGDHVASGRTGHWILYRSEGGHHGYTVVDGTSTTLPALDDRDVTVPLREALTGAGLYAPEADAMIETWRGDWFNDGLRAFWIYDSAAVDKVLPLTLSPAPTQRVRVLVGRTEMILPAWREEARVLATTHDADLEQALTDRFGRFALPVATLAIDTSPGGEILFERIPQFTSAETADNPVVR